MRNVSVLPAVKNEFHVALLNLTEFKMMKVRFSRWAVTLNYESQRISARERARRTA